MFTFEMSGFDELERRLQQLAENAEAMDGEHSVPLTELCPPAFMARNTDFATIEEMFEASGFTVETPEDFAAIPDAEWDAFIASRTRFSDRQIVQSCKTLDDFLPGFTPSGRHLISVRSVVQVHPGPFPSQSHGGRISSRLGDERIGEQDQMRQVEKEVQQDSGFHTFREVIGCAVADARESG